MTDDDKALVERLRELGIRSAFIAADRIEELCEISVALDRQLQKHDELIEAQAAEIERLREECQAQYDRGYYDGRGDMGEWE